MIEAIWSLHTPFASDHFSHLLKYTNMYKNTCTKYVYHLVYILEAWII